MLKKYGLGILLLFFCKGNAQNREKTYDNILIPKNSSYWNFNLQDSVQSVRWFYVSFREGLSEKEKNNMMYYNNLRAIYQYGEFDRHGTLKKLINNVNPFDGPLEFSKANRYTYDENDRLKKSKCKVKWQSSFPILDYNQLLKINYVLDSSVFDIIIKFSYEYKYNIDGKITEELEYQSDSTVINPTKKDLYTRKVFYYDSQGNLVEQKIYAGEGAEGMPYTNLGTELGFCSDLHILYEYDIQQRMTKITMEGCKSVGAVYEYVYDEKKGYVSSVKSYIPGLSSEPVPRKVLHYNEYGDIIELNYIVPAKPYDTRSASARIRQPANRYYEYDYDSHHNWIRCRLYLEGKKEGEPSAIAERRIIYYTD